MNILVTGASGFIGSNLVEKLKQLNYNVTTLDIKGTPDYKVDISTNEKINIKEDIDVIFHLAAQPFGKGSEINPYMDTDYNVKGTLNVCYLAKEKNVKKFIYTSTTAVYGDNEFADEESELNPLSNYAVSKLSGEFYVKKFSQDVGFNYHILRLWNTYGKGQDLTNENKGVVSVFTNQVLKGKEINVTGSLDRIRDIIHVDDVVSSLIHMLSIEHSDVYNVSNGIPITIRELIHTIIQQSNQNITDFDIKNIGGHVGDQFKCVGNNSKLKEAGWEPCVSIEDGLNDFIEYVKEYQNGK